MIVLQSSGSSQTFSFIPRTYTEGNTYTIKINNESSNKEVFSATSTSFAEVDYYRQYSNTFTLVENIFYNLEITEGGNLIYKDKIFCTNQTVSNYKINHNEYTTNTQNNEFVFI